MAKARLYGKDAKAKETALSVLVHVLGALLKMLHPFMPFITEEVYLHLPGTRGTIMTAPWPAADEGLYFEREAEEAAMAMEAIKAVRNIRAEMNVAPSARPRMVIVSADPGAFSELVPYIEKLAWAGGVSVRTDRAGADEKAVALVCSGCEVFIPLAELVDVEKERERLSKEAEKLENEIRRARAKLDNPGFVEKAPAAVVEAEREKAKKFGRMLETVRERLWNLQG